MFTTYRNEKYKLHEIRHPQSHNCRQKHVPNADPSRSHLNVSYCAVPGDFEAALRKRCDEVGVKITKSARCLAEHVITASPEFFQGKDAGQIHEWMNHALDFFYEKYGKENIIAYDLHMDEKTPHLHVMHVPLCHLKGVKVATDTGKKQTKQVYSEKLRLNYDGLLGGNKANQTKLQDEVAEHMQIRYPELARGLKSKDKEVQHQRVKDWYSHIEESGQKQIKAIFNQLSQIQNTKSGGILSTIKKLDVVAQAKAKSDKLDEVERYLDNDLRPQLQSVFEQLEVIQQENDRLKKNEVESAARLRELASNSRLAELQQQVEHLASENTRIHRERQELEQQLEHSQNLNQRLKTAQIEAQARFETVLEESVANAKAEMEIETQKRTERELASVMSGYDRMHKRLVSIEKKVPGLINQTGQKLNLQSLAITDEQKRYASDLKTTTTKHNMRQ